MFEISKLQAYTITVMVINETKLDKTQLVGLAAIVAGLTVSTSNWSNYGGAVDAHAMKAYQDELTEESGIKVDAPLQQPLKPYAQIMFEEYGYVPPTYADDETEKIQKISA